MIYLILNKYSSFIHLFIVHLFLPSKNSFWWSRLEDILKTPFVFIFKGRLQDVFKTSWSRRIYPPLSHVFRRRLQDIFKMSCVLQNVFKTSCKGVFKTLQYVSSSNTVLFNTSSRRIRHIFETYYENDYLQKDFPSSHFWEIYGQLTKFPKVNSLDIYRYF